MSGPDLDAQVAELRERVAALEACQRPVRGEADRRLGIADLEVRLHVNRTTIWRWCAVGRFPPPEYLGGRRLWLVGVVEAWERQEASHPSGRARNLGAAAEPGGGRRRRAPNAP